jgi:hypothetical protein
MTEQNPIVTWVVALECNDTTLLRWQGFFADPAFAAVRLENGEDGQPHWFLRSARFDGLRDIEIHKVAKELLAVLNGAAQVHGVLDRSGNVHGLGWKVGMGLPAYILADGTRKSMRETNSGGSGSEFTTQTQESDAQRWVKLAEKDKDVKDALTHFACLDDWGELYKTREVIIADVAQRRGIDKDKVRLEDQGWGIAEEDAKALSATMSYHRHHKGGKPSKNMDEARGIMRLALLGWLKDKMQP